MFGLLIYCNTHRSKMGSMLWALLAVVVVCTCVTPTLSYGTGQPYKVTYDPDNYCGFRWDAYNGTCYSVREDLNTTRVTAQTKCAQNDSKLLTVDSLEVLNHVRKTSYDLVWTSLRREVRTGAWKWGDGSLFRPNVLKWARKPDNLGGVKNCAAVYISTGKLIDVSCSVFEAYRVCQKPDVIPDVRTVSGPDGCGGSGWLRVDTSCYFTAENKFSGWDEAHRACQGVGAHLVRVDSETKRTWFGAAALKTLDIWTDLCYADGQWKWSDGRVVDITKMKYFNRRCAAVSTSGTNYRRDCLNTYHYICEIPATASDVCPTSWTFYKQSCYFANDSRNETWSNAKRQCKIDAASQNADTFVPNNRAEAQFVEKTVLVNKKMDTYYWTGLTNAQSQTWWYEGHQNGSLVQIDVGHIKWRWSPKIPSGDCALINRGFLDNWPKRATFHTMCERTPIAH